MDCNQGSRQEGQKTAWSASLSCQSVSQVGSQGAKVATTEQEEAVDLAVLTKSRDAFGWHGTHNKQPVVVHFESQMWKLFVSFQSRNLPLSQYIAQIRFTWWRAVALVWRSMLA